MTRCDWAKTVLEIDYHDQEWGKPKYDDAILFEMLILEGLRIIARPWMVLIPKRLRIMIKIN